MGLGLGGRRLGGRRLGRLGSFGRLSCHHSFFHVREVIVTSRSATTTGNTHGIWNILLSTVEHHLSTVAIKRSVGSLHSISYQFNVKKHTAIRVANKFRAIEIRIVVSNRCKIKTEFASQRDTEFHDCVSSRRLFLQLREQKTTSRNLWMIV